jgi:hypothetical protein
MFRRNVLDFDMENYEKAFNEFNEKITLITGIITGYFSDPLKFHMIYRFSCFKKWSCYI